jgi:uncharacterized RDD family membrane protein YckC
MNQKETESNFVIATIGSRLLALIVDSLLIGIVGFLFGHFLPSLIKSLNGYEQSIGLVFSLIYLTLCNSNYRKGQTWGKEFFNIQVVTTSGDFLSIKQSLFRSLTLVGPYFLTDLVPVILPNNSILSFLSTALFQAFNLSIIIIFLANKKTRQSLHDLIMGTYVVNTSRSETAIRIVPASKKLYYIFYGLLVLSLSYYSILYFQNNFANTNKFQNIETNNNNNNNNNNGASKLAEDIQSFSDGATAKFTERTKTVNGVSSHEIEVSFSDIAFDEDHLENNPIVKKTIVYLLDSITNVADYDHIIISFHQGFDIGIASSDKNYNISKTPKEWEAFVKEH